MMLPNEIKNQILTSLINQVNVDKIILFGSFASGTPTNESDIDLIVVTTDNFMPKNFEENMKNYLKVASALRNIKKNISMDLIVYTKPMYNKFIELGSMFSKEIVRNGEILYEKDN